MLIRSQDKKTIVNMCNVARVTIEQIKDSDYRIAAGYIYIGTYSTEEKAIKVLDRIQKEYGKHIYGQGGQMVTVDYYVPPFAFIPPKVFQMPQDSEV